MDADTRRERVESYGDAYARLVRSLRQFPREMWQFRDAHGCWSIHEHIVHIADSEANSYVRCRKFIAEPGESLMAYDENRWAAALNYQDQSTEEALELFQHLRRRTYALIGSLTEAMWSNTAHHPEDGRMTLDDWLDVYERHASEHVQYMRENYDPWLGQRS